MNATLRIGKWPFDLGQRVRLSWIQSPYRKNGKWCCDVSFRPLDGSEKCHVATLPWGALPILKIGQPYMNGEPMNDSRWEDQEKEITLPDGPPEIMQAKGALPQSLHDWLPSSALEERCFVYMTASPKIVIPVVEAIRAILAPTRFLSLALLEPQALLRLVVEHQLVDELEMLKLSISDEIPGPALKNDVIRQMARLLYDPSYRRAWDRVYFNREMAGGPISPHLNCPLPDIDPKISGRVVTRGDVMVVTEITKVWPAWDLPFNDIAVSHPSFKKKKKIPSKTEIEPKGTKERRTKPRKVVESEGVSPLNPNQPKMIQIPGWAGASSSEITVRKILNEIEGNGEGGGSGPGDTLGETGEPREDLEVTVGEPGSSNGKGCAAAEFVHVPGGAFPAEPGDGLDEFSCVMQAFQVQNPDLRVIYRVESMHEEAPGFKAIKDAPRKFAFMKVLWQEGSCWIIEFGRPEKHCISTLLFSIPPAMRTAKGEDILKRLIANSLTAHGQWNLTAFDSVDLEGARARLMPHKSWRPDTRSKRLFEQAQWLKNVLVGLTRSGDLPTAA